MDKLIEFLGYQCKLTFGVYGNGRTAIQLIITDSGEPMCTATVNLIGQAQEPDEVAIKNYSENEGLFEAMFQAGIVSMPVRMAKAGWMEVPICKLLIQIPK